MPDRSVGSPTQRLLYLPKPHRLVRPAAGKYLAIWTEGQTPDLAALNDKDEPSDRLASGRVPQLHRAGPIAAREDISIRGERQASVPRLKFVSIVPCL